MAIVDEYDFYPCLVDDAPASIYVNLRFESAPPPPEDSTLYTVAIKLRAAGEHGIGTADEAAAINLVEEAVIARATELAITYVGRLRTRGVWEIVLYGPPGHVDALHAVTHEHAGARTIDVRSHADETWSYYRELLLPDAERRQWMNDRRLVTILGEQGDRLVTPRRVDHWLAFPSSPARTAFLADATAAGFQTGIVVDGDGELPYLAHVHRDDAIELEHIHDVVMTLVDAATPHGGRYDRWEAGITT